MFKNASIKSRLVFTIGLMSVLLLGVGIYGMVGMSKANDGLKTVYEDRTISLAQLGDIEAKLLRNRLHIAISLNRSEERR